MKLNKILLIDNCDIDNFINNTLIQTSGLGVETRTFQSAQSALDYLQSIAEKPQEIPELIFLDLGMQLMNGFDFLEEFITLPASISEHTKIIVLTSSLDRNDRLRSKAYPCVLDLLEKPMRVDRWKALLAS
jgi:CheY-like chemotaxis protein